MLRLRQPDHRDKRPTITIGCCQSQTDWEEKKHKFVCTMLLLVEQTTPRVWEPGTPGSKTAETAERERKAEYNCWLSMASQKYCLGVTDPSFGSNQAWDWISSMMPIHITWNSENLITAEIYTFQLPTHCLLTLMTNSMCTTPGISCQSNTQPSLRWNWILMWYCIRMRQIKQ